MPVYGQDLLPGECRNAAKEILRSMAVFAFSGCPEQVSELPQVGAHIVAVLRMQVWRGHV